MATPLLHPALRWLNWKLAICRVQRMLDSIRRPRRLALVLIALALGLVWVGQAVATIFLRQPADPERLRSWITMSLALYAAWGAIKVLFRTPVPPFEWTPVEREWLLASPLPREQIIRYRLFQLLVAAIAKAGLFGFLMLPDLPAWWFSSTGMLLGLCLIDLLRLHLEVWVDGISNRVRRLARGAAAAGIGWIVVADVVWVVRHTDVLRELSTAASLGFLVKLWEGLLVLGATPLGQGITLPFQGVTRVMFANFGSLEWLVMAIPLGFLVVFGGHSLGWLDARVRRRKNRLERLHCRKQRTAARETCPTSLPSAEPARNRLRRAAIPFLAGAGPLAWRQWQGAWHYRQQLLFAVTVPFVLSCLPLLAGLPARAVMFNVVGAVIFYSFLLLPTSFKFDFRRDVDRLAFLKSLPIAPRQIVLGQLLTPILLTLGFQYLTLLVAWCWQPGPWAGLAIAMGVMLPLNCLIFGFENLVFLYSPHRLNQEGLHVLVRTILVFTAKSLAFALGLGLVFGWLMLVRTGIAVWKPAHAEWWQPLIFGGGLLIALIAAAAIVFELLVSAYRRLDPSIDLAGLD